MKQLIALFGLFAFLLSCGSNPTPSSKKFQALKVDRLTEEDLFVYQKVNAFLDKKKDEKNTDSLFLKGLDAYKNAKELDKASAFFIQSILQKPSGIAYYELGNVYLEKGNYDNAIHAFEMAERIGYEPFSKILYNIACAYSLKGDQSMAGHYLEYAIQAGYVNIDHIQKDKDLAALREESYTFRYHLNNGLKGLDDAENLYWLQFKRLFPKQATLPLKLDEKLDILLLNDQTRISYDYEKYITEMRDERFSREVSKGFYYLANVKETKDYIALIYVMKEEFFGDEAPLTFRLVTFTPSGELIDKKEIAGRSIMEDPLKSAVIKKDLSIVVTSYETTFEKDPKEDGYYNNKIVKKTRLDSKTYTINSTGEIKEKRVELAVR